MNVLVTGGAGYIGSHVVRMLLKRNHSVVIIDNLSRGHIESLPEGVKFEQVNLLDYDDLRTAISSHKIDAVIHFAAFAYVGESVENPGLYYVNNVTGSINLVMLLMKITLRKLYSPLLARFMETPGMSRFLKKRN